MTIAVVILNWNGLKLLQKFLPDVVLYSAEATIYIADNASTDKSVLYVKDNFPSVKIIQNLENGGFAKGYNDALSQLSEDIFVLLNSDVQVTPHWLDALSHILQRDPDIAVVQPKILDYKNPEYFEYAGAAGGFIDNYGYPFCRGRIFDCVEKDLGQYDNEQQIFWASGACMAIKSEVYRNAGQLDQDFFAHQEEIDLCWRINNMGKQIWFTPKSIVYHVGGATLNKMNSKKTFYNFRNSLYNLVKNLPSHKIISVLFVRMVLDGIAAFRYLLKGEVSNFTAVFKAHSEFYRNFFRMKRKRNNQKFVLNYSHLNSLVLAHYIQKKNKFFNL